MNSKSKKNPPEAGGKPADRKALPSVEINSLAQLEAIHQKPIEVEVYMRGQLVRIKGRLLKPVESEPIRMLLRQALPPQLPPEKEGDQPRFDLRNPDYLSQSERNRRMARALALFTAYPIFREGIGDKATRDEIFKHIETRDIDDDVLDTLFDALVKDERGLQHYVGFI